MADINDAPVEPTSPEIAATPSAPAEAAATVPAVPTTSPAPTAPAEPGKVPVYMKAFAALCFVDGILSLPVLLLFYGIIILAIYTGVDGITIGTDITLTVTVTIFGAVLELVTSIALIVFGRMLWKSKRRHAARWANVLAVLTVGQILVQIMLGGIDAQLIRPIVQLIILAVISITVDPSLRRERKLQRHLRDYVDREAAEEGMLGRDLSGEGYIKLNFFNLFWVFFVCCVLGLIIEVIYHVLVVDPGVYQDRAGMLYGPFSPIYGFGAVLLTIALNRFYNKSFLLIFVVSAIIGGTFEAAVSWWMQTSFGAVAWSYPLELSAGIPDPVAVLYGGRTSLPFACMWGALGVAWIKFCLPRLLALINLIPWKMRYSLTVATAALMVVNGSLTLGALDCWFSRESGLAPTSPVEQFFADHYDNDYMANRFQSMTIHPDTTSRVGNKAA